MNRRNFSQLLQKYLDSNCSAAEKELVESWFSLLDDEERWQQLSKKDLQEIEQKLWIRLQASSASFDVTQNTPAPSKIFRFRSTFKIPAAVLFFLAGAALVYKLAQSSLPASGTLTVAGWLKKTNENTKPISVIFEDGSRIELTGGATVYYPQHFEKNRREVKIEGTAFFEIAKDSAKPFYVHSQDIVTRVLGTSFWIVYDKVKKESAVEVVSGKVSVYKRDATEEKKPVETEGVLLKPNEKVIFNTTEKVFVTALVDAPIPVKIDSVQTAVKRFVYDETALAIVIRDLETEYGISILLSDEGLNNLQFTGNVSSLDYYAKLKSICKSLQVSYEIKGNRILLTRK